MVKKVQTFADIIERLKRIGQPDLALAFATSKHEDMARLKSSGLPCCKEFTLPARDFDIGNLALMDYLTSCKGHTIRKLPRTEGDVRDYCLGVRDFTECKSWLDANLKQGVEYDIMLTEFEEADFCGQIVSSEHEVLIETAIGNLPDLSHGRRNPVMSARFAPGYRGRPHHFQSISYIEHPEAVMQTEYKGAEHARALIWKALSYVRILTPEQEGIPDIRFWQGYFEFLVWQGDRIVFCDYKVNKAYTNKKESPIETIGDYLQDDSYFKQV